LSLVLPTSAVAGACSGDDGAEGALELVLLLLVSLESLLILPDIMVVSNCNDEDSHAG
jgi:hypothetical protein